jgi:hypothetical protein
MSTLISFVIKIIIIIRQLADLRFINHSCQAAANLPFGNNRTQITLILMIFMILFLQWATQLH